MIELTDKQEAEDEKRQEAWADAVGLARSEISNEASIGHVRAMRSLALFPMSTLYLSTHIEPLAQRLAELLDLQTRTGDFFEPTVIVVPHRAVGQWLRLWLARQRGIAMNLRVLYLEASLWEMLRSVDPRPQDPPPELLDGDLYRLLVLHVLATETDNSGLDYWHRLLQGGSAHARVHGRRLWRLADKLAALIRDYEYHRQDALIQHWLRGEPGLDAGHRDLELGQQAIFRAITHIPDGLRAQLNARTGRNFKTLPQYAMEVMELSSLVERPVRPIVHLFGLTQISALHARTVHWLGRFFDLRVYHVNVLAGRIGKEPGSAPLIQLAQEVRATQSAEPGKDRPAAGADLLRAWGKGAAESLHTMAELCAGPHGFVVETVRDEEPELPLFDLVQNSTVLRVLQHHLIGVQPRPTTGRQPQDRSLQILGCPGMVREVETVYDSILANLREQSDLKQSDVAVLAADMELYRPVLQAVFERRERRLHYNLSDFSAAGVSIFGQALVGMLDLALDSFTRNGVLAVLLNPCFLARLGIERSQALVWIDWVQALGIYQSWDQGDKRERGYADSPLFAWQLGLRRLRLGRIMDVSRLEQPGPAFRFDSVIPYADVHSSDAEELNHFCLAVDTLLPRLARLRQMQGSAADWVGELESLIHNFLDIPAERPDETQVRDRLLVAMQQWKLVGNQGSGVRDQGSGADGKPGQQTTDDSQLTTDNWQLPLVREMVQSSLQGMEGVRGQYSAGGVTIAALAPLKPMPFRIVYIIGLGEDVFPGSNVLSGFDLRALRPSPGDIRPAEYNRHLFLETLLAVRDKVYLLYNNLDIQKDQILHPAVPLQQLKRYLTEHVLDQEFAETPIPLLPNDECYVRAMENGPGTTTDALVHFDESDRLLALTSAQRDGGLVLTAAQQTELERLVRTRQVVFSPPVVETRTPRMGTPATIRLRDLAGYLEFPVPAALRFHLGLRDDGQDELLEDEPFVSDQRAAMGLMRQTLDWMVQRWLQTDVDQAVSGWKQQFASFYEDWSLRGQVPEEAFGQVDRDALEGDLSQRIKALAEFLGPRRQADYCGPILLGESVVPIGAKQRFAGLTVPLNRPLPRQPLGQARLVGSVLHAWRGDSQIDVLVWCLQNQGECRDLMRYLFEPGLFYLSLCADRSMRDWLGQRAFEIHIAHAEKICGCKYDAGFVDADQARFYLSHLTTDFLDPNCLDLLPLRKIIDRKDLYRAINERTDQLGNLRQEYAGLLREHLDEDAESGTWNRWLTPLVELAGAHVPDDAFDKIRRRFWLFHFFG